MGGPPAYTPLPFSETATAQPNDIMHLYLDTEETGGAVHPIQAYLTSEGAGGLLDTILVGNDGEVQCHAVVILPRVSSYLHQQEGDYTIILPDYSIKDLEQMLSYCYTGRCVGQHTGALSSLLEVLNFEKKHVDDTASAEGVGGEFIDHDGPLVDQVSTSLQDEENNELNVTVESPEISVRSSNIPKRALVMLPKVVKYNHDPSPNLNKKVKVINPEATDSNIKCDYCEMSFKYKQTLNRHVKEFHLDKTDLFVCESCNFLFRRKENLQRHILKTCLKNLNLVHKCKNCKLMFDNEVKLNTHVEKNCTKKYLCITCLKYFKKKKDFLSHDH